MPSWISETDIEEMGAVTLPADALMGAAVATVDLARRKRSDDRIALARVELRSSPRRSVQAVPSFCSAGPPPGCPRWIGSSLCSVEELLQVAQHAEASWRSSALPCGPSPRPRFLSFASASFFLASAFGLGFCLGLRLLALAIFFASASALAFVPAASAFALASASVFACSAAFAFSMASASAFSISFFSSLGRGLGGNLALPARLQVGGSEQRVSWAASRLSSFSATFISSWTLGQEPAHRACPRPDRLAARSFPPRGRRAAGFAAARTSRSSRPW